MRKEVLIISEDPLILDGLKKALRNDDVIVAFADSEIAVQERLKESQYCLMVWDTQQALLFHFYRTVRLEKPVEISTCAEQIRSIFQQEQNIQLSDEALTFGSELVIDRKYHSITIKGIQILLTPTEFELLHYMAKNPGQIFSTKQLYTHVWGDIPGLGMEKTVKVHLSNLRRKLSDVGKSYIQNVRGVGYRFFPPSKKERMKYIIERIFKDEI